MSVVENAGMIERSELGWEVSVGAVSDVPGMVQTSGSGMVPFSAVAPLLSDKPLRRPTRTRPLPEREPRLKRDATRMTAVSAELLALAERAAASCKARRNEDIETWAGRLAKDVGHLTD